MSFLKTMSFAATVIAITATSSFAGEFKRITKRAEFTQAVIGKTVYADWGSIMYTNDGTLSGKSKRGSVEGTWKWKGKFYCSNVKVGGEQRPRDCFTVHLSGKNIVFIRNKGKGDQLPMKIK